MTDQQNDKLFDKLVHRSLVPVGYRPRTDADIEAMLDAIGGEPLAEEQYERMLCKIRGEEPVGVEREQIHPTSPLKETEEERELAAMYRAEGEELPPEIQEKLKKLEEEAAKPADEDDAEDENHG